MIELEEEKRKNTHIISFFFLLSSFRSPTLAINTKAQEILRGVSGVLQNFGGFSMFLVVAAARFYRE